MHIRHEKAAAALVAIRRALERHRPLAGVESVFLSLYDWVAGVDAEAFTEVWLDPTCHYWVSLTHRRLYRTLAELRAAGEASEESRRQLAEALDGFKAIALGAAVASGDDLHFAEPWRVAGPLAVPGTRMTLVGEKLAILGVRGGGLRLDGSADATVLQCPVAAYDGLEIRLKPSAFDLPEFDFGTRLQSLPVEFQAERVGTLEAALEHLDRYHPAAFRMFREIMRVVAFKPPDMGGFANLSHADLPGACILNALADPHALASVLIHELHHNRLFLLEDEGGLLEQGPTALDGEGEVYSPFREDLRPIGGLLHAVYVFVPTLEYWLAIHERGGVSSELARFVRARIPHLLGQLEIGLTLLGNHGRFSASGRRLIDRLSGDVQTLRGEIEPIGLSLDQPYWRALPEGTFVLQIDPRDGHPMTVREVLIQHMDRFDARGQCAELRRALAA